MDRAKAAGRQAPGNPISRLFMAPRSSEINRVVGVGMSKTGTTTLADCFEILGFTPHKGYDPTLRAARKKPGGVEKILKTAERYRSFEDSPWFHVYRELDQRFPGSKFILTVRRDSMTHAKSSWNHGVRGGTRRGASTEEYLQEKIRVYEQHNAGVREYFKDRPDDLLVICWENGDGWEKLCPFLGVPVPGVPIPHSNQGRYSERSAAWVRRFEGSTPFMYLLRLKRALVTFRTKVWG
jgi:hypothetical protein